MAASTSIGIGLVHPELLGTYGDSGNATVLAQRLRWRGIPARIVEIGPGRPVPADVRVLVLGGGEDRALPALLADRQLGTNLAAAVDRGAAVFGVCAGLQLLGREFIGPDGAVEPGLGLLDCTSHRLERRAVGECVAHLDNARPTVKELVLTGFENHRGGTLVGPGSVPLSRIHVGVGNGDGTDGAVSGRVVGTYFHGPVLARNPLLADRILESVIGELGPLPMPLVDLLRVERMSAALSGGSSARSDRVGRFRRRRAASGSR